MINLHSDGSVKRTDLDYNGGRILKTFVVQEKSRTREYLSVSGPALQMAIDLEVLNEGDIFTYTQLPNFGYPSFLSLIDTRHS